MIITGMSIVTYALRLSMIALFDRYSMPEVLRRPLPFVAPAVLSAFVVPALLAPNGALDASLVNARLFAGALAAVVAWRTRNVFLTIGVGMGLLWILQAMW